MESVSASDALTLLQEGNVRFASGKCEAPNRDNNRLLSTGRTGQEPFAAVVSCSDSRVPVSVLFDRGIGDIFTVRLAGNIIDKSVIGSLEYAVKYLQIRLIVILGHSSCGAVQATVSGLQDSPHINHVIGKIRPALDLISSQENFHNENDRVDTAAKVNVHFQIQKLLDQSEAIRQALSENSLMLKGAFYNLISGSVEWLD